MQTILKPDLSFASANFNPSLLAAGMPHPHNQAMLEYDDDFAAARYAEIARRLRAAIDSKPRGMRSRLAKLCGVTPQAVKSWTEAGKVAAAHHQVIADELGEDVRHLFLVDDKRRPVSPDRSLPATDSASGQKPSFARFSDSHPDLSMPHHVPIISWEDALMAKDLFDSGEIRSRQTTPYTGPYTGGRLVVLHQDDTSMTRLSGSGQSFPPGTEYIIDIDRAPAPGQYVLVAGAGRAYLRQLVVDVRGRRLIPLNPQFEPSDDQGTYIGVLVDAKASLYSIE